MSTPQPELILLPGMDGTGRLFAPLREALASHGFTAEVVSFPTNTVQKSTDLIATIRDATRNCSNVILIAESFSTPLAIQFASTQPSNLRGLILCAGFARSPLQGLRATLARATAPLLFRARLPEFAVRRFLAGRDASDQFISEVSTAVSSVAPEVLAQRLRWILQCDARKSLASIRVPLLYIRATQDRLVNQDAASEILGLQPAATLREINGPHLILQARPEEAAELISEFAHLCLDKVER